MKKIFTLLTLTGAFCLASAIPALAGTWQEDSMGWWYQNDNGSYPMNTWQWIDGNEDGIAECYYFNSIGYLLTNTRTPDDCSVNQNGAWTVNGLVQTKQTFETIEISNYLNDDNVYGVANAIGGMEITSTAEFKQCARQGNLIIGILADKESEFSPGYMDEYNSITDIINTGNKRITLFGVQIGDSFEEVKINLYTDAIDCGNGTYEFWNGDAAVFRGTFINNKLVSYQYELRYTG